jgi:hypothetical protein
MSQTITAPLYDRRPGDASPLHAYLRLDLSDGEWSTATRGNGDGTPVREWHGHVQKFSVVAEISQRGIDDIIGDEEVKELAKKACAGYSEEWDGHNHVAKLAGEAREAIEELSLRISELSEEADTIAIWEPGDWLNGVTSWRAEGTECRIDDIGTIRHDTTDEALSEMARKLEVDADSEKVLLDPGPLTHLEHLRGRCEIPE